MSTWSATAGARLGDRYELEAKVGEGGMGEVWRAKHLALENQVAIKFLSGSLANNDETKKRFLMEAKLTAQLRSRHAVQVFDFGLTEDDQPYLVMELLHGEPLSNRIERTRHLSLQETASFMSAAAKALHRAHALGIVHRDFKPDNVFLTKGEEQEVEVKVVDFGIAKLIGSLDEARPSATDFAEITGKALSTLTRTGKLVGTPHYMSPEQVRMSAEVGPAADIWAFGVVAFESLTGECPFDGHSVIELFSKIQLGKSRKARSFNPEIPEAFDDWFKVACAVDPSLRFPDAQIAATLLADALGVSIGGPVPASELSNPRLMLTSSPDISIVSSTDALSRSPSKPTLLSSATDHESVPKKSRTAMWGAMASVLIAIGAVGVIEYNAAHRDSSLHASSQPAAVTGATHVDALPSATTSAIAALTSPAASAAPSASVAAAAPEDSANLPANSAKNTGKIHGSHGAHIGHGSSNDTPAAAPDSTQAPRPAHPTQPAPTATGPASPFSLPPLGL